MIMLKGWTKSKRIQLAENQIVDGAGGRVYVPPNQQVRQAVGPNGLVTAGTQTGSWGYLSHPDPYRQSMGPATNQSSTWGNIGKGGKGGVHLEWLSEA